MAVQTGVGDLEILHPITTRTARLFKKGAPTGNETFDRVWSDFHGKMGAPENENREFHEVLAEHDGKHQVLVSLGKLNYMMNVGGFDDWIGEGYAASTGDMLVKKLPAHTHVYPLLSKLRDMLKAILEAYSEFGIQSFAQLDHLLYVGVSRATLWNWFRVKHKKMFRFRGRVTEPHDLEVVSGKWGHTRLDEEPLTDDLVEHYEAELAETEAELAVIPEGKPSKTRNHLLEMQAELDSLLEALHYRFTLQKAWKEFKTGGWGASADKVINTLNARYRETFTLDALVDEASEWFDATPDEVYPIEWEGEEIAQDVQEEELPKAASLS